MSMEIRLRRGLAAQWTSANTVLGPGEAGYETDTRKLKIGDGSTAWNSLPYFIGNLPGGSLNDLGDVTITDAANGDFLRWNGTAWVNDAVNLGTDTIGNYVVDIAGGTGVTVSHTPGEASTASISIGQAVGTSSSVTFAAVTAPLIGNADTASQLATSRVIALSGDVTGSVSFNGGSDVDISAIIQPNSVALGTDTTGNFMTDVAAGTGVTITHTPGEGSTASIAIGQSVATNASVQFANVDTTGDVTVGGNLTVNGTTTTLNTETLAVEDNIIVLNSNATGAPSTNAGIEVERGDSANVLIRWNESTDSWEVTEDGTNYKNIAVGQDVETSSSVTFAEVRASSASISGDLTVNGTLDATTQIHVGNQQVPDYDANMYMNNGAFNVVTGSAAGVNIEVGGTSWLTMYSGGRISTGNTPEIHFTSASVVNAASAALSASTVTASTFTGALVGNANTASSLQNARTIALSGDVSGSVSFDGSASVNINTEIQPNSVALGTDTTGNYMADVVAGTGIAITHTPGEGSSASVALNAGLNELSDVVIVGTPEKYQTLGYDGAGWVNSYAPVVSYVRNAEATTLTTGTVVYLFGGNGDHATVKRADNSSEATSSKTVGLINGSIAANENGAVVTRGYVSGMNLSAYSVGDVLWLGTNGEFTTTKPSAPQHLVYVGVVVRATNNGIIYVATQNGYEIEELHDVKITSPQNNDFLKYNSASAIWVNEPITLGTDTTGNYMTDVVAGTNISVTHTQGEGSSASIAVSDNPSFTGNVSASAYFGNVFRAYDGGQVSWMGPEDDIGSIYWAPTDTRNVYLPDVSGSIVTTGDTGTVTSTMIANGTIDGSDISETAGIGLLKLQYGSSGEMIVAAADGTPTWQAITGDISVNASGVVTIAADAVALGTNTTGNYVVDLAGGTGVTISHTPGEGSTASVSIGQAVATTSSVTFAHVTASAVSISVTPQSATDAATKGYVDQVTAGINWHESVAYATAATLPNSPDYSAGSADQSSGTGIGATLTATTYGRLQVDGANTSTNQRVLVKNQSNAIHNGVYDVTEQGSASVYWILTRADDSNNSVAEQVKTGDAVYVVNGTVNAAQGFLISSTGSLSGNTIQIGTDNIDWTQFTGTATFTAGTGLSTSGNTINVNTANSGRIVVNADNIDLAEVTPTYQAGSASNQFITSVIPDAYGRFTGAIISPIREASTTQTGIASFNSGQFTVSSGSVSIKSGGITSTEIANGTIVNSDVSETAGIALMKLQYGSSGEMIVAAADGTPTWQAITGDISVNASGVATIAANSVALGVDTTGNYLVNVVAQPGLVVTHTPGEGSTASIGLDSVIASSNAGSSGTNFLSAITVDGYGRVTAYTASDVQDASTSAKGIAQFNSSHFSVSSGSVSLNTSACPTFAGINVTGTASVNSASITTASVGGTLTAASTTVRIKYGTNQSIIALNGNGSSASADVFQLISNYNIGTTDYTGHLLMKDSTNTSTRSGMVFRQSSSNAGIDVGPRLLVTSSGANDPLMSLSELTAASAVFFVNRHTSGSVGVVLKEFGSSSTNMLEVRDSNSTSYLTIGGSSNNFRLTANSASIVSASISTASISTASVSGNLTVGGNLTINGTTTTVNSTTVTIDDPIFTLGGDMAPSSDDNKDRGIEFRYHSGTAASVGFMGYDDSTGRFIFLTGATNTSEVFSGTSGSIDVGALFISSIADEKFIEIGRYSSYGGYVQANYASANPNVFIRISSEQSEGPRLTLSSYSGSGYMGLNSSSVFTFTRPIHSASLQIGHETDSSSAGFIAFNQQSDTVGRITVKNPVGVIGTSGNYLSTLVDASYAWMVVGSGTASAEILRTSATATGASVAFMSSASITLPAKTFFPEEYLTVSSSVTLNATTHRYATLEMTASAGTSVITVPADASSDFPVGSVIQIIRVGAGEVQVTASAGVTVNNALGSRLRAQWSTATLRKRAANTWLLSGDLKV